MVESDAVNDFFDQNFWKNIISALIGTGTALAVFYLTIRSDNKKEKERAQENDLNRIRHFSNLVRSSITQVESIISNLDKMVSEYDNDVLNFQPLKFTPNKSFTRLESLLKNENYFLAYSNIFGEDQVRAFNSLSVEVDYFNMQIELLWEIVEKSQKFDHDRKKKFKKQVEELMNYTAWLTTQPNLLEQDDLSKLSTYLAEFHNNFTDPSDLSYPYDYIRKILETVLINYMEVKEVYSELPKFKETSSLFQEIQIQNTRHKEDLKDLSVNLRKALDNYKQDARELLNHPSRFK